MNWKKAKQTPAFSEWEAWWNNAYDNLYDEDGSFPGYESIDEDFLVGPLIHYFGEHGIWIHTYHNIFPDKKVIWTAHINGATGIRHQIRSDDRMKVFFMAVLWAFENFNKE